MRLALRLYDGYTMDDRQHGMLDLGQACGVGPRKEAAARKKAHRSSNDALDRDIGGNAALAWVVTAQGEKLAQAISARR